MSKKIHFTDENTNYLLLNIVSHDVIHDYGPSGCSKQRWEKNKNLVKQFYSDYFTFTNPLKGGDFDDNILKRQRRTYDNSSGNYSSVTTITDEKQKDNRQMEIARLYPDKNIYGFVPSENRRILKVKRKDAAGIPGEPIVPNFPGPKKILGTIQDSNTESYFNYIKAIKEMKSMINTTIIFTFFNHFLYYNNRTINYYLSNYYIIPFDNSVIDHEIFEDLSNKFIGSCNIHGVSVNLNYTDYLNILCNFLSSYAVEQTIFENLDFQDIEAIEKKRLRAGKKQYGGKDNKLTVDEANQLISQINALITEPDSQQTLKELNDLLQVGAEKLTKEQKDLYTLTRKTFLKKYKDILLSFDQKKKAGSIDGDLNYIPPIDIRRGRSSGVLNLVSSFPEKINALLYDVHEVIKEYEKQQQQIEKKRLEELEAELRGDLTRQDKEVRDNFASFIAKSGLFLTNICDANGNINTTNTNELVSTSALRKQINILLYIADWTRNIGWQEIRSQDLDTILLEYFKANYFSYQITESTGQRYVCRTDKYVINNAANVETQLKNKSFCPYSSILDGMSLCSWNSSVGEREYGNMNFKITNTAENLYYNGIMNILEGGVNLDLSFEVALQRTILSGKKQIKISGNDLEAHFVLKNTLVNVINYILSLDDTTRSEIFTGGNIFLNLFNKFTTDLTGFNLVFSEILFKGTGDLFQEINSVCKYGGYTMDNYFTDPEILSYNGTTGNQLRLFAANDRPSGTRFIFMLINANIEEINLNAVGGYYSEDLFLVKRPELQTICASSKGGKTKKKRKTSKKTRKNHKIRNKIR